MPNFKKLADQGCFQQLKTAYPSISPVAWSSYATGVDASRHNIYDFLTRDPCNYLPTLSSTDIRSIPKTLNLGLAKVPFGQKTVYRILQKSQPFWKLLGRERRVVLDRSRPDHLPAAEVQERNPALGDVRARPAGHAGFVQLLLDEASRPALTSAVSSTASPARTGRSSPT